MPTFGRLTAAILFAPLCWYVSLLAVPLFSEGKMPAMWAEINTVIGLWMGWVVAGKRAGDGYNAAISYGLTTLVAIIFWSLFSHSFIEMIDRSLNKRYDGPAEAVVSIFELGAEIGQFLATPLVLGTLLIGSLVAALVTEFIGSRFS